MFHTGDTGVWSGDVSHHPRLWDHYRDLQGQNRTGAEHRGRLWHATGEYIIFHHTFLIYSLQLKKLELKENPVVLVIN